MSSPFKIRDCNFISVTVTLTLKNTYSKKSQVNMSILFLNQIMTLELFNYNHLPIFHFFCLNFSFTLFKFLSSVVIIIVVNSNSQ